MSKFNELLGKTLSKIEISDSKDEMVFYCEDGDKYIMLHYQDCCENVYIEDINGNLDNLIGSPIVRADEKSNHDEDETYWISRTYTFYTLATNKGYVDIRWIGESNGYYSEKVNFKKIDREERNNG